MRPYDEGFYLDKLTFSWPGVGARAFYRVRSRKLGNVDGQDGAALALVKANEKLSNEKIAAMLHNAGISRSAEWVRRHRARIARILP